MAEQEGPNGEAGLPDYGNLSSAVTAVMLWMDDRGIHLGFWDLEYMRSVPEGSVLEDIVPHARFIHSCSAIQLLTMQESITRMVLRVMASNIDPQAPVSSPAPYDADYRIRIHEAWHGGTEPKPANPKQLWEEQIGNILDGWTGPQGEPGGAD